MGCSLEITENIELVEAIIKLPDIWERIAEDGIDKDEFKPEINDMTAWILCKKDNDIIGIILVHFDNSVSLKIHPYLMKEYRFLGRDVMEKVYEWFLSLPDSINKIVTTIPSNQKKVHNFAKKVGFIDEGVNRESYMKNNILFDQWNLGITRKEIQEYLK